MNIKTLLETMESCIDMVFCIDSSPVIAYHHNIEPFTMEQVIKFNDILKNYIDNNSERLYQNRSELIEKLENECSEIYSIVDKVICDDIYLIYNEQFINDFILENINTYDLYQNYWGLGDYGMVKRYIANNDLENDMVQIDFDKVLIMVE